MYHHFLITLSELNRNKKSNIIINDFEVIIEQTINKNYWVLSSIVFRMGEKIPTNVQPCVFSCGVLQWQDFGPYLKMDIENNAIKLMHHVKVPVNFISFRNLIKNFEKIAIEWRETLHELSGSESLLSLKNFS